MWNGVTVLTPPASLAPDLMVDIKSHLRVDWEEDDALITRYINAAVARLDGPNGIGVAMLTQTWRKSLDDFPETILLPGFPLASVTSVNYLDVDGAPQTVAAIDYHLDTDRDPARLVEEIGSSWPGSRDLPGAVWVDYVVGSAFADVDDALIDAVMLYVAHRYANREAIDNGSLMETPLGFMSICNEHTRVHAAS